MRRLGALGLAAAVFLGVWCAGEPASALEETVCGVEEHVHDDACYESVQKLVCALPEVTAHIHDGDCCVLTEGHAHGAECLDEAGALVCAREESESVSVLICPRAEVIPHVHGEDCRDGAGALICGMEEVLEHTHDGGCYEMEQVLVCEQEEHVHGASCYEARTAATSLLDGAAILSIEEAVVAVDAEEDETCYTGGAQSGDLSAVSGDGIRFRLFNYSLDINKTSDGSAWRTISGYFTFRNSQLVTGTVPGEDVHIPAPNINAAHDEDGFTASHATVERLLDGSGYPVLDLTRNADGTARTDPGIGASVRSLAYLFGGAADHAVTAYSPANTILQKSGSRYWYDSAVNAVDYDVSAGVFRLRSYAERNSTTAGYGGGYGDFLPFTYTGGAVLGRSGNGTAYHVLNEDADYWFGMTMEVDFYQTKDGLIDGEEMVFRFSGDDDVWVFVDGVLVLDLGGTHGTVDGSINFATGEVLQYLSWGGANSSAEAQNSGTATSFPTTIRECFDAAGQTPVGGWSGDGQTFGDYTEHTLTFFYLERGAAVANCALDFRLPTLPDKSLTITKVLESGGQEELESYVEDSLAYAFRVVRASDGEPFLPPGTEYDLLSGGVKIGEGAVDAEGLFYLRAGQSAQFQDMLQKGSGAVEYVVQEIMPDALTGQYGAVEYEVSGQGGETEAEEGPTEVFTAFETSVLSAEATQTVTFRNRVDSSRLCRLAVTKEAGEGTVIDPAESFEILVRLGEELLPVGTEYTVDGEVRAVAEDGVLVLRAGETAVLSAGILSGTAYEIVERPVAGYTAYYAGAVTVDGGTVALSGSDEGLSGKFPLGSTVSVLVANHSYELPETGGPGRGAYSGAGLLLTMAGAALLFGRRRRGRREAAH